MFAAQSAGATDAETDAFKCGKCGQRKTRYYQMQTRSADEPMTVSVLVAGERGMADERWDADFCYVREGLGWLGMAQY